MLDGCRAQSRLDRADMVLMNGLLLAPLYGACQLGCSQEIGAVAQLGEHLLCKQGVSGSIPLSSTILGPDAVASCSISSVDAL